MRFITVPLRLAGVAMLLGGIAVVRLIGLPWRLPQEEVSRPRRSAVAR